MSYNSKICLDEFSFNAGNPFEIKFIVYDQQGLPFDLTDYTTSMKFCQYGDVRNIVDIISGTINISESSVIYSISGTDSQNLSGKYSCQIVLEHTSGTKYVPKQFSFMVVERINWKWKKLYWPIITILEIYK